MNFTNMMIKTYLHSKRCNRHFVAFLVAFNETEFIETGLASPVELHTVADRIVLSW